MRSVTWHIGRIPAGLLIAALAVAVQAQSPPDADAPQAVRDAWIDGWLESAYALNDHLGAFDIDTRVAKGVVHLSGTVKSRVERDLATEIAAAMDGVEKVDNGLTVDTGTSTVSQRPVDPDQRTFAQRIRDATATARVKSNLLANGSVKRLSIDVNTENDVVILHGAVPSRKDKMLAEMIARNTDGIANVRNRLEISEQT